MPALLLQKDLKEELKKITNDMQFKKQTGEETTLTVFEQFLPIKLGNNPEKPFPFIVVEVDTGEILLDEAHIVKTFLYIGLYDNNPERKGYEGILNIIHRIYERFAKNPILKERYMVGNKIDWVIQRDENLHPHYFGGMEISWKMKTISKEDPYT